MRYYIGSKKELIVVIDKLDRIEDYLDDHRLILSSFNKSDQSRHYRMFWALHRLLQKRCHQLTMSLVDFLQTSDDPRLIKFALNKIRTCNLESLSLKQT